jgi:cytochrome c oxidase subunit I
MFTTRAVLLPFFSLMSFLIAIPTGIKFFNWVGHYVARPAHLRR